MMETKIIHCIQNTECRTELGQSIGISAEGIFDTQAMTWPIYFIPAVWAQTTTFLTGPDPLHGIFYNSSQIKEQFINNCV